MDAHLIDVGPGRVLEVADTGRPGQPAIVFHSGTPVGFVPWEPLVRAAADRGVRLVTSVRPGYGRSTPQPGRAVADVAADMAVVAGVLDIPAYVSIGHSGGGPHALACRALDPPRCRAAVTIAGVAPFDADGLDFLAGMGEDNVEEFGAAIAGDPALTELLTPVAAAMADIQPDDFVESIGSLLPEVDRAHLTAGMADYFAAAFRTGVASGIAGWHDDDLAFVRPWGFDVAGLTNVSIWQGTDDLMVPFAHGRWLAATITAATPHLLDGEGHLSLLATRLDAVVDEAVAHLA